MKKTLLSFLLISLSFLLFSCKKEPIKVSFYEEENANPRVVEIYKGKTVNEPSNPVKSGYKFMGWFTNLENEVPFNFQASLQEDLNLYAKWEIDFDMSLKGTKTFPADALWAYRDKQKTTNLQLINGNIMVIDASKSANYESLTITSDVFVELVLSWNVRDLTAATINFKVAIGKGDTFSKDFIMGIWKKNSPASSVADSDSFASLSHDILSNKNIANNLLKLKFSVFPNNDADFKINNISVTAKKDYSALHVDESILSNIELNVPRINQYTVPNIGNVICSPTSVTMVLNYYGYNYLPQTIAGWVRDTRSGLYGNWTFNASTAGGHDDLYARVEYMNDYAKAYDYIKNGIPVILSVKTDTAADLPGALSGYPSGHLIVLIGFEYKNGVWYGILNDAAFYNDNDVRKLYPLDLLMKAHRGYTYIISTDPLN